MKTFLLLILTLTFGQAASVTLAWNASDTLDVQYRIKWGFASGAINQTHIVEAGTALILTIEEPWAPGTTIYFTAYAWNDGGESIPSNEVSYTIPILPTPTPTPAPPEPPTNLRRILQSVWIWLSSRFS